MSEEYLEEFDMDLLLGRVIMTAEISEDTLKVTFTDGAHFTLRDAGQSCCEHRYLTCDDDPASLIGGCIVHIDGKGGPSITAEPDDDGYVWSGEHDTMFLEVQSTSGFITMCTHNEHNGYYGGFSPKIDFRLKHVPDAQERKFKRMLLSGVVLQNKLLP
jgi:hypothetical protein